MGFDNIHDKIREETTSADIAFLPGGFRSKQKKVKVPSDKPDTKVKKVKDSDLEEEVNAELKIVRKKLLRAFTKKLKHHSIYILSNNAHRFISIFGISKRKTPLTTMVAGETRFSDMLKIRSVIVGAYDDIGTIEQVTDALNSDGDFASFIPFNEYKFFYGTTIVSKDIEGIRLEYNCGLDMAMMSRESITIPDKDMLSAIGDSRRFSISGNTVLPKHGTFQPSDFKLIYKLITDIEDEEIENAK